MPLPTFNAHDLPARASAGGRASHRVNPRLLAQIVARVRAGEEVGAVLDALSIRRPELRSAYVDALLASLRRSGARLVWGRSSDRPGGAVHVHAPNGAPSPAAPGA